MLSPTLERVRLQADAQYDLMKAVNLITLERGLSTAEKIGESRRQTKLRNAGKLPAPPTTQRLVEAP